MEGSPPRLRARSRRLLPPDPPPQRRKKLPVSSTTPGDLTPSVKIVVRPHPGQIIQPLLGVNAGPLATAAKPASVDATAAYRQAGVTLIRTHDYYGPLDTAAMYPDLARDPGDPVAYDFRASDAVWETIVEGGFEPYLRLYDSWNNVRAPSSPKERARWVQAATQVVAHYYNGKWGGFHTPSRYAEIWNEPDLARFWPDSNTVLDYYAFYAEPARALKEEFPDLKVDGPAATQAACFLRQGRRWLHNFLSYVREEDAPLDFVSWHLYSNDPQDFAEAVTFYTQELEVTGFGEAEIHVTEWNTDTRELPDASPEAAALRSGAKGAAILTAAWIAMQEGGVDVATFCRGVDPEPGLPFFYGLFFGDGSPKRVALAFSLWSQLASYSQRLAVQTAPQGLLWVLARENTAGRRALLVANPEESPVVYTAAGLTGATEEATPLAVLEVNDQNSRVVSRTVSGRAMDIGPYTVQLLLPAE